RLKFGTRRSVSLQVWIRTNWRTLLRQRPNSANSAAREILGRATLCGATNHVGSDVATISPMRRETEGKGNQTDAKDRQSNRGAFGIAEKLGGRGAKCGHGSFPDIAQHSLHLHEGIQRQRGWGKSYDLPR